MTTVRNANEQVVDKDRLVYFESDRIDTNIGRMGISFRGYVITISVLAGIGFAVVGAALGGLFAQAVAFAVVGAAAYPSEMKLVAVPMSALAGAGGFAFMLSRQVERWNRLVRVRIVHEYEVAEETAARKGEVVDKLHVIIKASDGRYAKFDQPEAGSFARLLRNATAQEPAVMKMRMARDFGWPDDLYRLMVQELRHIGWLHVTETINKAPVFTDVGKAEALGWLRR